jgi:protein-S-isoprenylcysteine O-methyltransferase Ste14
MALPFPASLALTLLLASPFQWFTVAGAKTFRIPRLNDSGAAWGGTAFLLGTAVVLWRGLFGKLGLGEAVMGLLFSVASLALYEWARRTIAGRRFIIGLGGEVPEAVCESGPYRYIRHPFYLSYVIASLGMLIASPTPAGIGVFVFNMTLFTYMAFDDERTLGASALAPAYYEYRQRVGFLLLLPGRR